MTQIESIVRVRQDDSKHSYRTAPHNTEAARPPLGPIPATSSALYRTSIFLEPVHFFDPIHHQIFEVARSLMRTGKLASPVTLKTFLPADADIAGLTLP